jgi:hypothetical protein
MRKLEVGKLERERKSRDGKGRMPEKIWREGEQVRRRGDGREEGSVAEGCDRVLKTLGRHCWELPSKEGEMKISDVWGPGLHLQKSTDHPFQLWLARDGHHLRQPAFVRVSIVLPMKYRAYVALVS